MNLFPMPACAALFVFVAGLAAPLSADDKPNVLLICIDDLKPVLGCYGDKFARTPNIDALAARSTRFDFAFCNQAVCSPSRNALLTSLRPQTLGIYNLETNFRVGKSDAVTLPQYFKQHGYHTEGIGKIFHTGHGNFNDEASWSLPHIHPKADVYAVEENLPPTKNKQSDARGAPVEASDAADDFYADGKIARGAVEKLQRLAKRPEQPFFLAVGFIRPHLPFVAPQKYWDLYRREDVPMPQVIAAPENAPHYARVARHEIVKYKGMPQVEGAYPDDVTRKLIHGYYAATSYMDAQLGLVLDELKRLQLDDDTIIVLWGDHGWHLGDHAMWAKHTNYEQAARIPLLVSAPGKGRNVGTKALVESVDVYPTLVELAGLPARDDLDGRSFAAVLADPAATGRDHAIHVYPRSPRLGRAVRDARYRMVEWKPIGAGIETAEYELYDYVADPLERRNLAEAQPEVLSRMKTLLAAHPEPKPEVAAKSKPKKKRK